MNKKGFTLIELLAVIVILAIIALIATPIVLNIINDAKESSDLRSADFYLDAVELAIAQSTLKGDSIIDGVYDIKDGNICRDVTCTKILEVELKGEVPKKGLILIKSGQIEDVSLNINNTVIGKNNKGEISNLDKLTDICKLKEDIEPTGLSVGDQYVCSVKPGTEKTLYVLEVGTNRIATSSLKENEVALILEGNYDKEMPAWCDPNGSHPYENICNADGLTGKLDEIATDWTKLKREQIVLPSIEQVATADGKDFTTQPTLEKTWLFHWSENIGYWVSTPYSGFNISAWYIGYDGKVGINGVSNQDIYGVRPVINLKI